MSVKGTRFSALAAVITTALIGLVAVIVLFRADHHEQPGVVLITGANRGIGLALAREYAGRGWTVIATTRQPDRATDLQSLAATQAKVRIERLDVTSEDDIASLKQRLQGTAIDVLINNAGSNAGGLGQTFGALEYAVLDQLVHVNVAGPLRMAEAFLPNVSASGQKKFVVISSGQASITNTFGGSYFYRASKAALNMSMRTLSRELAKSDVIVGILSPGVVATDMNKGLDYPMITPQDSAHRLADVIQGLGHEESGEFMGIDGNKIEW